jgi:threonine dehydratase
MVTGRQRQRTRIASDNQREDASVISRSEISRAHGRIKEFVRRTPVLECPAGQATPAGVTLKLEHLQVTRTFKPRGVFNRILSNPTPEAGVVTASGGNAGLAVAYAARRLGIRAEIFVPATTPRVKLDRIRALGAEAVVGGSAYADAYEASLVRVAETHALFVHAYDQHEVVAGQGTIGLELEDQAPGLDTVLVAVGGGGLFAGIASWFDPSVRVLPVEPSGCPTLSQALKNGGPVDVAVSGIAQDSLGARRIGEVAYKQAADRGEAPILVSDDEIATALRLLWDEFGLVVEPGGATAMAALTSGAYRPRPAERVCVITCGANTDPATVHQAAS